MPDPDNPATITEQSDNEAACRLLLIQGALAVLLPTEDLQNGCLRTLLGEILAELIIGQAIGARACEGRFWMDVIIRMAEIQHGRPSTPTPKSTGADRPFPGITEEEDYAFKLPRTLWLILRWGYLALSILRFVIVDILAPSSLSHRKLPLVVGGGLAAPTAPAVAVTKTTFRTSSSSSSSLDADEKSQLATAPAVVVRRPRKRPILAMRVWSCTANLLDLSTRMPWLHGLVQLLQHGLIKGPWRVGDTDGALDR